MQICILFQIFLIFAFSLFSYSLTWLELRSAVSEKLSLLKGFQKGSRGRI